MDRWRGKVAVVTGASAGIGLETAKILLRQGVIVVGLARRKALMEEGMKDVPGKEQFYARECDITKEQSVLETFNWIKNTLGSVNILVNNAGVIKHKKIEEITTAELDNIIDVNLKGVLYCIKQAISLMKVNGEEAHIINVNSVLGHVLPSFEPVSFNVYPATKFAITALSGTLRNELANSKIRVTSVSPGLVKTEMRDMAVKVNSVYSNIPALESTDVANAIVYVLGVPENVNINELTLQAKK